MRNKKLFIFLAGLAWGILAVNFAHAQTVQVTDPYNDVCLAQGTAYTIVWSQSPDVDHVELFYSYSGNEAGATSIYQSIPGQTSYMWIVPSPDTMYGKIFIHGLSSTNDIIATGESSGSFHIMMNCDNGGNYPVITTEPTAINITGTGAQITWSTDIASGSYVNYGTNSGSPDLYSTDRCDAGGYVTSHCVNLTNLSPSTIYYYITWSGNTQSGEYQFTSDSSAGPNAPSAPYNLTAGLEPSEVDIYLNWSDSSTNETEFKIYQRYNSGSWAYLTSVGTDINHFTIYSASSGLYEYYVIACNTDGCSSATNNASITVGSGDGGGGGGGDGGGDSGYPPSPPSNLVASMGTSGIDVDLNWQDNSTDETYFEIYRRDSGSSWSYHGHADANITYFTDHSTWPGDFEYYVVACNNYGCSYWENSAWITVGVSGGATVSGVVTDSAGNFIYNAFVEVYKTDHSDSYGAGTDPSGNYTIYNVAEGSYKIVAHPSQDSNFLSSAPEDITLSPGQVLTKDLVLISSSKTIKGRVEWGDGSAVTDAYVDAKEVSTDTWAHTETDSSGNYSLPVTGGYWEVYVNPETSSVGWVYNQPPQTVIFANDAVPEEAILNFTVTTVDATVSGIVLKPDGTPPAQNTVFVDLSSSDGVGFGNPVKPDGSFHIELTVGTYDVHIHAEDPSLTGPVIDPVTVTMGETKDLGTIMLVEATKRIKGRVMREDGSVITDAYVNAHQPETDRWAGTQTDPSGNYTLSVTSGFWEVHVNPKLSSSDWAYNQPPQTVIFSDDASFEEEILDFTVISADARAEGYVLKPDGTAPAKDKVFIDFRKSDGTGFGASIDSSGHFDVRLSAGTYDIFIYVEEPGFTAPDSVSLTFASGEVKNLGTIMLVEAVKTIKGRVMREDGSAVTDAEVGAFDKELQKWVGTGVDNLGNYILSVTGGVWELSVHPRGVSSDWNYGDPPQMISFATDNTVEEKIVDFVVTTTDAVVKGQVLKPDGTVPARDMVFVGLRRSDGLEFGGPVDSSGLFRISLTAGSYSMFVHSNDPLLAVPSLPPVTVALGETKNIGTITLVKKNEHIKGFVFDEDNKGIAGVEIEAWMFDGEGYARVTTDSDGSFDILVTPGKWEVQPRPDPMMNLYNPGPPKRITIETGDVVSVNFTLYPADAGISGTVVDKDGNLLTNLYGFASLEKTMQFGPELGGSIERGSFSFKAPAGTYALRLFFPPGSAYTAREAQIVTLVSGQTINVQVVVSENTSVITGFLKDEAGNIITGIDAHIFANSQAGVWQEAFFDMSTGEYTVSVSAGTWYLGYDIDPVSGYMSLHKTEIEVVIADDETIIKDLVVKKADTTITGRVTDPEGNGVSYAFVGVSKTGFASAIETDEFKDPVVAGTDTDASGYYSILVPAGTYFVKTFVSPERGFISPKEQSISLVSGETVELNLQLRSAPVHISGSVFLGDVTVVDAFVWAWSEYGGYQESFSQIDGTFRLNVTPSDKWVVGASYERDGVFYKSNEISVDVENSNVIHDIYLEKVDDLPSAVSQTSDATKPAVVEVEEGPTVVAPANAVASGGSISISVTPDTRAPSQGEVKVVGTAYDFEARDDTGQVVSSFNTDIIVTIPYEEGDVVDLGTTEDNLIMAFWEELVGTWKPLDNSVVNDEENIVTAAVDHFTRFAIVAAADITPPNAPTGLTLTALGNGETKLTWQNPMRDFDHAKIYRSEEADELGEVRTSEVFVGVYVDTGTDGTTYYYTVRAVDPAGNESNNVNQVSVVAIGTAAEDAPVIEKPELPPGQAVKAEILRNLTVGNTGDDVTTLQQFLLDEGVYPEGLITGYFGNLTKQAVIRFQEKYLGEILTPVGLTKGTGFFGPSTRKKLNELLGGLELPPGQAVKAEILRNLTVGNTGDDVTTLQQFLLDEGVYPEGLITGYFGSLTKQAVIRFQEKYLDEVLTPVGLTKGTGFFGPSTRAKLNEILK